MNGSNTLSQDVMFKVAQTTAEVYVMLSYPQDYRQVHYVNGTRIVVSIGEHRDPPAPKVSTVRS